MLSASQYQQPKLSDMATDLLEGLIEISSANLEDDVWDDVEEAYMSSQMASKSISVFGLYPEQPQGVVKRSLKEKLMQDLFLHDSSRKFIAQLGFNLMSGTVDSLVCDVVRTATDFKIASQELEKAKLVTCKEIYGVLLCVPHSFYEGQQEVSIPSKKALEIVNKIQKEADKFAQSEEFKKQLLEAYLSQNKQAVEASVQENIKQDKQLQTDNKRVAELTLIVKQPVKNMEAIVYDGLRNVTFPQLTRLRKKIKEPRPNWQERFLTGLLGETYSRSQWILQNKFTKRDWNNVSHVDQSKIECLIELNSLNFASQQIKKQVLAPSLQARVEEELIYLNQLKQVYKNVQSELKSLSRSSEELAMLRVKTIQRARDIRKAVEEGFANLVSNEKIMNF